MYFACMLNFCHCSFTTLMITAATLTIWYSRERTSYLRILTDFSRWTVRSCESEPGGACSEEKCNYVAILFIFIYIITTTTITTTNQEILLHVLKKSDATEEVFIFII